MKITITDKLRSRTGASISFALLLFLVCTALCSVILAAATAASGRMSGIAESDQKYYAVTSAAELLKDSFREKDTVSIGKVRERSYIITFTDGIQSGVRTGNWSAYHKYISEAVLREDDLINPSSIPTLASSNIDTLQKAIAANYYDSLSFPTSEFNLTSGFYNAAGFDYDALAAVIRINTDIDGNIEMQVSNKWKSNAVPSDSGSRYTLSAYFGNNSTDTNSTPYRPLEPVREFVSSTVIGENSYEEEYKEYEIEIVTLIWSLTDIKVG